MVFNLMLAAAVRCRSAMIRVDYIIFMDPTMSKLTPSIASKLLTVKAVKKQTVSLESHCIRYLVSEGGE